jgi:signal transduction histidine kinase
MPRLSPRAVDVLVALLLLAGGEVQAWVTGDAPTLKRAGAALAVLGVAAGVAVRRRFPAAVGIGVQGLLVASSELSLPTAAAGPPVLIVGWFCALYALAVWTPERWFWIGLGFFIASDLVPLAFRSDKPRSVTIFTLVAAVVMLLVRRVVGDRDQRLRLTEREREQRTREAVFEERARIARELHDAVAHDVSLMVLQAGAERRAAEAASSSTRATLETIEETGRGTLAELRRLVGLLRS